MLETEGLRTVGKVDDDREPKNSIPIDVQEEILQEIPATEPCSGPEKDNPACPAGVQPAPA